VVRPSSTPAAAVPTTSTWATIKSEKNVEVISKFYFPDELIAKTSSNDAIILKQLKQAKEELFIPKNDKLCLEDFGKLGQVFSLFRKILKIMMNQIEKVDFLCSYYKRNTQRCN
jgi:hypothetical protein